VDSDVYPGKGQSVYCYEHQERVAEYWVEALESDRVLDKYRQEVAPTPSPPDTPPDATSLDLALLNSSPPDGTEVRKATALFNSELREPGPLTSPAKRFGERMTRILEMTQNKNAVLHRELSEAKELL
jgi:hypothetical protein